MSMLLSNELSNIVSDIRLDTVVENKPLPPWMFNLEGTFLGYLSEENAKKAKSIVIEVAQEQLAVELPKRLRASVHRSIHQKSLKPGDRIRCVGRSQLNFSLGVVQLKAYCLFLESSDGEDAGKTVNDRQLIRQAHTEDNATHRELTELGSTKTQKNTALSVDKRKQAKILICHKSGCKKRGGRQLMGVLKQILESYELQKQVEIQYTGCQKRCSKAPALTIIPGNYLYDRLSPNSLPAIIEKHFCQSLAASSALS